MLQFPYDLNPILQSHIIRIPCCSLHLILSITLQSPSNLNPMLQSMHDHEILNPLLQSPHDSRLIAVSFLPELSTSRISPYNIYTATVVENSYMYAMQLAATLALVTPPGKYQ